MVITGATGSLGSELVARYHSHFEVFAHGRNADRLLKLKIQYPGIHLNLGDLPCHGLREAAAQSHVVVHTAAQKYVDLAEKHGWYTFDTNVVCTQELAELTVRHGAEHFIFLSTDKASGPSNLYGTTKYLAE